MTILDTLRAARAVIADSTCWTQGVMGCRPGPHCAWGAIVSVADIKGAEYRGALRSLGFFFFGELATFNDTHTHAEVLALFDKAIAAEEAKAAPADVPLYVPSAWLPVEVPA